MVQLELLIAGLLLAAPAPAVDCKSFEAAIDGSLKAQATSIAADMGDNSAPRATLSELRISNQWRRIEVNLRLMEAAGCPLPTAPITGTEYLSPALSCETERLKMINRAIQARSSVVGLSPPECNSDNWRRSQVEQATPLDLNPPGPQSGEIGTMPEATSESQVAPRPLVTLAEFDQVKIGMMLTEVESIVRKPGERSTLMYSDPETTDYTWKNVGSGAYMKLTFKAGKVTQKHQLGLE